eukprot:gene10860-biopygen8689
MDVWCRLINEQNFVRSQTGVARELLLPTSSCRPQTAARLQTAVGSRHKPAHHHRRVPVPMPTARQLPDLMDADDDGRLGDCGAMDTAREDGYTVLAWAGIMCSTSMVEQLILYAEHIVQRYCVIVSWLFRECIAAFTIFRFNLSAAWG